MLDESLVKSVVKKTSANFSDQLDFLSELVLAKSDNPDCNGVGDVSDLVEEEVAGMLVSRLKGMKLKPELVGNDSKRENVICRAGPGRARKSLILHACMDTNQFNNDYRGDPLRTFSRGERMYGWGIWNMKASISVYIFALKALMDLDYELAGRLMMMFVVDGITGSGSSLGTKFLLHKGYRAKAAILGSPGPAVGIGHRGGYRFKLSTMGEAVHTGSLAWQTRERGKSAIEEMVKAIKVLGKTEIPFKHAKAFPGKKPVFTFPTMISGGEAVNRVPEKCEAFGDVRLMPGNSHKQVRMRIEENLDSIDGLSYKLNDVLYVPASEIDNKEEVVKSVIDAYEMVMGESSQVEGIGPWNNGWVFAKKDIPAVIQLPLVGGVSRWGLEWVNMTSLKRLTAIMALSVAQYLGVKEKD